jgi:hypothetical protein
MLTLFRGGVSPRAGGRQSPGRQQPPQLTWKMCVGVTSVFFLLLVQLQGAFLTRSATFNIFPEEEIADGNQQPTILVNHQHELGGAEASSKKRKPQNMTTMLRASSITHKTASNDQEKLYALNEDPSNTTKEQIVDKKDSRSKELKENRKEKEDGSDDYYYENIESHKEDGKYPLDKNEFPYPLTWELGKEVPFAEPRHILPKQERGRAYKPSVV